MGNPRKRVHALRRAPDGSAFEKCRSCGVLVAIALFDMHECGTKVEVKRFKGVCEKRNVLKQCSGGTGDQLRSPFRYFMESFVNKCKSGKMIDIDRKGFEAWKNMSDKERQPYVIRAKKVYAAHERALFAEVNNIVEVDDEADSAMVGKVDKFYEDLEFDKEPEVFWRSEFPSWDNSDREIAQDWIF